MVTSPDDDCGVGSSGDATLADFDHRDQGESIGIRRRFDGTMIGVGKCEHRVTP
jgi:hypothetical protein